MILLNKSTPITRVVIYRAYDILFLGYYEYAIREYCLLHNINLQIKSPKHAKITYSPRNIGIRGQMYIELFSMDSKCVKKIFVDISDGYDDLRLEIAKKVDTYVKCNYNHEYTTAVFKSLDLKNNIVPGSMFLPINFIKNRFSLWLYYCVSFFELIGFDQETNLKNDIKRWKVHVQRAKVLFGRPSIAFYNNNRTLSNFDIDVFFSASTWYNEDQKLFHERAEIIHAIRKLNNFNVLAEFIYNRQAKFIYPDLMGISKRPLSQYFELLTKSKVVIINKSLSGGAISWRVGECYALGKVFIHECTPNDLYHTLFLDEEYGIYYDSEDLIKKINRILTDNLLYEKLLRKVEENYNKYFNLIPTAEYILNSNGIK